jgi:hypothetical protein
MTETSVPPPQQTSRPGLPPVDPSALVATFVAVLKAPAQFFKTIKDEKGFQKCLVFSVAMSVVAGVVSALWPLLHGQVITALAVIVGTVIFGGILGPFIGGLIIWIISMIFGSKAPYEPSVRISAYAYAVGPIVAVCNLVPFIGWLAGLVVWVYGIYIAYLGAKELNFEPAPAAPPAA